MSSSNRKICLCTFGPSFVINFHFNAKNSLYKIYLNSLNVVCDGFVANFITPSNMSPNSFCSSRSFVHFKYSNKWHNNEIKKSSEQKIIKKNSHFFLDSFILDYKPTIQCTNIVILLHFANKNKINEKIKTFFKWKLPTKISK